jgi:hypothetical protein
MIQNTKYTYPAIDTNGKTSNGKNISQMPQKVAKI